jgi:pilus assembly protein CpaB
MPGDRVDVLLTYKVRRSGVGMVSKVKTVLEYIKVFATDAMRSSTVTGSETAEIQAKNISLLVSPEQANLLMLAESKGQLCLALRRIDDDEKGNAPSITDAEFDEEQTSYGLTADDDRERSSEDSTVRELLEEETQDAPQPPPQVVEVVEPEKPTWKVTIYSGDEVRVEEVDLPEDPTPVSAGAEGDAAKSKRAGFEGFLQRFFSGA